MTRREHEAKILTERRIENEAYAKRATGQYSNDIMELVEIVEDSHRREEAIEGHIVIEAMRNFVANPQMPTLQLAPDFVEEFLAILDGKILPVKLERR